MYKTISHQNKNTIDVNAQKKAAECYAAFTFAKLYTISNTDKIGPGKRLFTFNLDHRSNAVNINDTCV